MKDSTLKDRLFSISMGGYLYMHIETVNGVHFVVPVLDPYEDRPIFGQVVSHSDRGFHKFRSLDDLLEEPKGGLSLFYQKRRYRYWRENLSYLLFLIHIHDSLSIKHIFGKPKDKWDSIHDYFVSPYQIGSYRNNGRRSDHKFARWKLQVTGLPVQAWKKFNKRRDLKLIAKDFLAGRKEVIFSIKEIEEVLKNKGQDGKVDQLLSAIRKRYRLVPFNLTKGQWKALKKTRYG